MQSSVHPGGPWNLHEGPQVRVVPFGAQPSEAQTTSRGDPVCATARGGNNVGFRVLDSCYWNLLESYVLSKEV